MNRQELLRLWFEDCEGKIELRALPMEQPHDRTFYKISDYFGIDTFCRKKLNKNLYFGLATRNGHGGTKADIIDIPGAWADIDFKNVPRKDADKLLKECPLQPTFIIQSGGGYHCYWRFKEPTDNIKIVEYINHQLLDYFESDNVCNADRILRLPDTFNYKYDPKRPVKVCVYNQNSQYNESDFEEHLPPVKNIGNNGKISNLPDWQNEALKGTTPGHRHHTATKLIGRYIEKGLSDQEILPIMQQWDRNNTSSIEKDYGTGELFKIIESIRKSDNRNHPPQEDPLQFPDIISGVSGRFAKLYSTN